MKRLKWNRKLSVLVLIMFITVTFASFNTNLFINGNAYVRVDRDIRITNIHLLETEYNGYENTNSEYTNRTISTDVSLPRQASSLTYEVTITNVSDKRYKITDIIEDSYDNPDVKYELIDASIGNIIEPHTTKTFRVKFTNRVTVVEEDDVYQTLTYTFDYTGGEQSFTAPYDGTYTLEVWGASGGKYTTLYHGGYGGYSKGDIHLNKNQKIFINVGGQGERYGKSDVVYEGGYNGGGSAKSTPYNAVYVSTGGGATHIATMKGVLSKLENYKGNILIVAGGGGGSMYYNASETNYYKGFGGSGGGFEGQDGNISEHVSGYTYSGVPTGGTQTQGGSKIYSKNGGGAKEYSQDGSFGQGGGVENLRTSGGGGGYYGGASATRMGAAGGSGYIGNTNLSNKEMYCYQCTESNDTATKTTATENYSTDPVPQYAKEGNGYAKITLTRKIQDGDEYDFDFTGGEQTFTAPYSGVYQLQTWGAQGGDSSFEKNGESYFANGGYGGYSSGNILLSKDDVLYIYNGGKGTSDNLFHQKTNNGGYNGGGTARSGGSDISASGGGATHIAFQTGLLSSFVNNQEKLLIVSGGGGGAGIHVSLALNPGGNAGGFKGSNGQTNYSGDIPNIATHYGTGGTQTAGGTNQHDSQYIPAGFGIGCAFNNGYRNVGGGSGYYGGGCGFSCAASGGGGSSYIGNELLKDKIMYCYECEESQDINTRTVSTKSHSLKPKKNTAKEGNGYSRITLLKRTINQTKLTLDFTFEEYVNGNEYTFGYTGSEQTFTVPKTGYYKLETWGAEGSTYVNGIGGYGGHSFGTIKLIKGEKLYINVGGKSRDKPYGEGKVVEGGYNGGGSSGDSGGGGATHISTLSGILSELEDNKDSIIIVAGGGGGGERTAGGSGGGFIGNTGTYGYANAHLSGATGGTQSAGGVGSVSNPDAAAHTQHGDGDSGSFGQGANSCMSDTCGAGAGGGGYYGGGSSHYASGGGGGSGYIGNGYLTDKAMYCYNCLESNEESTKTVSTTDVSSDPISNNAKSGDGFAKITLIEEIPEYTFDYTGDVQEFVAPYRGVYKVELWGAQGGNAKEDDENLGAYTSGLIELTKNKKLYLYVGSEGSISDYTQNAECEFNGGGRATKYSSRETYFQGTGGGATDIRLKNGNWNNFDSLSSRIMVASSGGGSFNIGTYKGLGGPGGGLVGYQGNLIDTSQHLWGESGTGGTQISGGYAQCLKEGEGCDTWSDYSYGIHYGIGGFGYGGNPPQIGSAGGGAGYFGGGSSMHSQSGGSGSSYISGHTGCVSINKNSTVDNISFVNDSNNISCNDENSVGYNSLGFNTDSICSKHYSGYVFNETSMIDGAGYSWDSNGVGNTIVGMPTHDGRATMIGNTGNGYAKITLVEKIDTYNISYDLDGGTLKNKKKTYSTFDDDITLGTPTKEDYTFTGWTGGINIFEPTLKMKNGNNVLTTGATVTLNGDTFTFAITAADAYYGMVMATGQSFNNKQDLIEIPSSADKVSILVTNSAFNKNHIGFFDENKISLGYERTYPNNSGTFNIPAGAKYMTVRFGMQGEGNIGNTYQTKVMASFNESIKEYIPYITVPQSITITNGSKGNRLYKANWTPNYNIEYDLDGGSISGNPTTYSRISNTLSLPIPTKNNYGFIGWIGGKNMIDYEPISISLHKTNRRTYDVFSKNIVVFTPGKYTITIPDLVMTDNNYSLGIELVDVMSSPILMNSNKITITLTETKTLKKIYFFISQDDGENAAATFSQIQIEKGTESTAYEKYISDPVKVLTIPSGLSGNRKYSAIYGENKKIVVVYDADYSKYGNTEYKNLLENIDCYNVEYAEGLTVEQYIAMDADAYVYIGHSWGINSTYKPILSSLFNSGKNVITTGDDSNSSALPFATTDYAMSEKIYARPAVSNGITNKYNATLLIPAHSRTLVKTQNTEVWYKVKVDTEEYDYIGRYVNSTYNNNWVWSSHKFFPDNKMFISIVNEII